MMIGCCRTRRDSAQSGGVADTLSGPTSLSERTKILVEEGLLGFSQPYPGRVEWPNRPLFE